MQGNHVFPNGIVTQQELRTFINPIKMTLSIPYRDIPEISGKKSDECIRELHHLFKDIFEKLIPTMNQHQIHNVSCISYTPHSNGKSLFGDKYTGFDFRIHPVDLTNRILKEIGINDQIPFINLDDPNAKEAYMNHLDRILRKNKTSILDSNLLDIANELQANKEHIYDLYEYPIEKLLYGGNMLLPKDALFYLACESLLKYKETNDRVYKILPYEYYKYVGPMEGILYPHSINIRGQRMWFDDFNIEYEQTIGKLYIPLFNEKALDEKEIIVGWEIFKKGAKDEETEEQIKRVISSRSASSNLEKYRKLYEMKVNFFRQSSYKAMIKGKFGLQGYVGFVYPNDYLIYDKFYNSDHVPDEKKTILSHPEAIYSLPSDLIELTAVDKQTLKKLKEEDERILKNNHTMNGSFINRLDNITRIPNVSTESFESIIERTSDGKTLIIHK